MEDRYIRSVEIDCDTLPSSSSAGYTCPHQYEETGSYQLTRLFLDGRERLIDQLLQEEEEDS